MTARLHDVNLAWVLLSCTRDHLSVQEHNLVCVELGGGDSSGAIRRLTMVAAREHVELSRNVGEALYAWWAAGGYVPDELREVLARVRS